MNIKETIKRNGSLISVILLVLLLAGAFFCLTRWLNETGEAREAEKAKGNAYSDIKDVLNELMDIKKRMTVTMKRQLSSSGDKVFCSQVR